MRIPTLISLPFACAIGALLDAQSAPAAKAAHAIEEGQVQATEAFGDKKDWG